MPPINGWAGTAHAFTSCDTPPATRLVNAGTPMKQIADVLRHRSIVTSATYTRVDSSRLTAVALCWPGSVA